MPMNDIDMVNVVEANLEAMPIGIQQLVRPLVQEVRMLRSHLSQVGASYKPFQAGCVCSVCEAIRAVTLR